MATTFYKGDDLGMRRVAQRLREEFEWVRDNYGAQMGRTPRPKPPAGVADYMETMRQPIRYGSLGGLTRRLKEWTYENVLR